MSPTSVVDRDRRKAVAAVPELQPGQYLAVEDGDAISVIPITGDVTKIGRSIAADIRLDDRTVSRTHARLVRRDEGLRIVDDRSMNGVFVNDRRTTDRLLRDGDTIALGRVEMRFLDVS